MAVACQIIVAFVLIAVATNKNTRKFLLHISAHHYQKTLPHQQQCSMKKKLQGNIKDNEVIQDMALQTGYFYAHMDGSICCFVCNKTIREGCKHGKFIITIEQVCHQ